MELTRGYVGLTLSQRNPLFFQKNNGALNLAMGYLVGSK